MSTKRKTNLLGTIVIGFGLSLIVGLGVSYLFKQPKFYNTYSNREITKKEYVNHVHTEHGEYYQKKSVLNYPLGILTGGITFGVTLILAGGHTIFSKK